MDTVQFKMETFEGPLDLLLHLVRKSKMNIYDIEILSLIDQYLSIVGTLNLETMDSASEFIEMAARLVQMKSYFLLPKSEEAEKLKEELTGLLIEYSLCKSIAAQLRVMAENTHLVVREPLEVETTTAYANYHHVWELSEALKRLHTKKSIVKEAPTQDFEPLVQAPFVSVSSRIIHILRGIITGKAKKLMSLFDKKSSRSQTVATFLALLELIRSGRVSIEGRDGLSISKSVRKE